MVRRTATCFSLALFPPVYLFRRVLDADVVLVLSDRHLDDKNHANQCVLRSFSGATRRIEIPVRKKGVPIDDVDVPDCSTWFPKLQEEVHGLYRGLPHASAAVELVSQLLPPYPSPSPWLVDYLMHSFVKTLEWLDWKREIVRGASVQRQRYVVDSEYLLDLCLQNGCQRLIVGTGSGMKDQALFRREGVNIISQQWQGSATLRAQDSILDAIARLSAADILRNMGRN